MAVNVTDISHHSFVSGILSRPTVSQICIFTMENIGLSFPWKVGRNRVVQPLIRQGELTIKNLI